MNNYRVGEALMIQRVMRGLFPVFLLLRVCSQRLPGSPIAHCPPHWIPARA